MESFDDVDYDEVPDELCEYSILVESVIDECDEGIRYVNYMTDEIYGMIRPNMSPEDTSRIIHSANTLIGIFGDRVSRINRKCTRMNEIMSNVTTEQSVKTPIQTSQGVTNLLSGMCAEVEALDQELGERIADVRAGFNDIRAGFNDIRAGLARFDDNFRDFMARNEADKAAFLAEFGDEYDFDAPCEISPDDIDWSEYM